jgi:hypothetical protein
MGYYVAFAPCVLCGVPFSFNPDKVPSTSAITGKREPICESCFGIINAKRVARGDAPFPLLPDAYGIAKETVH